MFGKYDVLLDNQADVSIVHPSLLRDVLIAESPITVKGIGGKQLRASHMGYLEEFFHVYASNQVVPSFLSLSDGVAMSLVYYFKDIGIKSPAIYLLSSIWLVKLRPRAELKS